MRHTRSEPIRQTASPPDECIGPAPAPSHVAQATRVRLAPAPVVEQQQRQFAWANGLLLVAFAGLTAALRTSALQRADRAATRRLQAVTNGPILTAVRIVSKAGERPAPVLLTTGSAVGLWLFGLRIEAGCTLLTMTQAPLNTLLKLLVRRPRPQAPLARLLFPRVIGSSFPSGHTMFYTVFFGFLTSLAFSLMRPSPERTAAIGGMGTLIAAIGPARVMLGAHWASDVTGAYLAGGAWLALLHALYRSWKRAAGSSATGGVAPGNEP